MTHDGVLDHTMIRVEDLDASVDWYTTHFGWEEKRRSERDTFTLSFLGPEDLHDQGAVLELTYNHDSRTYDLGDSWGHIAVRVPNGELEAEYERLMDEGVEDYRDPESCGGRYAFVRDPDGHEVEIVQRDHGARFSIDHTMIRVEDADQVIGWYARKLGYELFRRHEFDTFALYFMKPEDAAREAMSVELTYNYDGRSYDLGDSWGHVAVRTDSLEGYWEQLMERGANDYRDPESCNYNYAFTKDPDGREIEVVVR